MNITFLHHGSKRILFSVSHSKWLIKTKGDYSCLAAVGIATIIDPNNKKLWIYSGNNAACIREQTDGRNMWLKNIVPVGGETKNYVHAPYSFTPPRLIFSVTVMCENIHKRQKQQLVCAVLLWTCHQSRDPVIHPP